MMSIHSRFHVPLALSVGVMKMLTFLACSKNVRPSPAPSPCLESQDFCNLKSAMRYEEKNNTFSSQPIKCCRMS